MRRDLFYFFDADVKSVYNAYIKAARVVFNKDCGASPYHAVDFGLSYSTKYNMNGGSCHIHFIPYKNGTAVAARYTVAQLFGAKYEKHYGELISFVEKEVSARGKILDNIEMEEFLKDENRMLDEGLKRSASIKTPTTATNYSSADEIKKFKELLDNGIITQEEFDAKKKQLLGL